MDLLPAIQKFLGCPAQPVGQSQVANASLANRPAAITLIPQTSTHLADLARWQSLLLLTTLVSQIYRPPPARESADLADREIPAGWHGHASHN